MTATIVSLLVIGIAAYVGVLGFVLALLTVAKRADDAAEQHARVLSARDDGSRSPNGAWRDGGVTAADVQSLQAPDRREAHEPVASGRSPPAKHRQARGRGPGLRVRNRGSG